MFLDLNSESLSQTLLPQQILNLPLAAAEIIKRRVAGLHQVSETGTMALVDVYEPKEGQEGLSRLEVSRNVSVTTITLSLDVLDSSLPGYQPPLPEDQVRCLPCRDKHMGILHEMSMCIQALVGAGNVHACMQNALGITVACAVSDRVNGVRKRRCLLHDTAAVRAMGIHISSNALSRLG